LRIATYQHQGRRQVGRVSADGARVAPMAIDCGGRGALALVERAAAGMPLPPDAGPALDVAAVRLEAPLPLPRRNLWCVARNDHAHAKELRETVFKSSPQSTDQWPIVFTKVPECVIGPGDVVRLPGDSISAQIDYEAELAVVIGRGGRNIARADALGHVFGWTIVNDVTARDVQMRHQQWDLGKSFDTFCPMGPWIVTADELDGTDTRVRCWVTPNGGSAQGGRRPGGGADDRACRQPDRVPRRARVPGLLGHRCQRHDRSGAPHRQARVMRAPPGLGPAPGPHRAGLTALAAQAPCRRSAR